MNHLAYRRQFAKHKATEKQRKPCATALLHICLNVGMSSAPLKELLGHTNLQTTMIYTPCSQEKHPGGYQPDQPSW